MNEFAGAATVTDAAAVDEAVTTAADGLGSLDVLVNNAASAGLGLPRRGGRLPADAAIASSGERFRLEVDVCALCGFVSPAAHADNHKPHTSRGDINR
jgi:NAD(P)-dependent dehydrogenase (short-subunit alcohol dehydrogenase family)